MRGAGRDAGNYCYRLSVSVASTVFVLLRVRLSPASPGRTDGNEAPSLHRNEPTRCRVESAADRFEFVTIEGLLAYGEMLARRTAGEGILFPPTPTSSVDRPQRTRDAMEKIRAFVQGTQGCFPGAEEYRTTRRVVIEEGCRGDELVFFAAWNALLAAGELAPLLRMPITSVRKPVHRRPVAIVPRAQLTPQLVEDRIVLDLGEDRFWMRGETVTVGAEGAGDIQNFGIA